MPSESRWPALQPFATRWEPATASGRLWDTGRGYPAIRFDAGGGAVPGFLVTLDADRVLTALAALDVIEAEGLLYRRVEMRTSGGPAVSYEWLGPTHGLVPLPGGWPPPE